MATKDCNEWNEGHLWSEKTHRNLAAVHKVGDANIKRTPCSQKRPASHEPNNVRYIVRYIYIYHSPDITHLLSGKTKSSQVLLSLKCLQMQTATALVLTACMSKKC